MAVLSNTGIRAGASIVTAGADDSYRVKRSTRFDKASTSYINRTPATVGNGRTYTISQWMKLYDIYTAGHLFSGHPSGHGVFLRINEANIVFGDYVGSYKWRLESTAEFRDPSAWYHIVCAVDTTQATAANRVKVYINGEQVTAWDQEVYPAQYQDTNFNWKYNHTIGVNYWNGAVNDYRNIGIADAHLVDGQQLAPTAFAETDAATGQWVPKEYEHVTATDSFHTYNNTVWSASASGTGHNAGTKKEHMFDGNMSGMYGGPGTSAFGDFTWTPPSAITVNTNARFAIYDYGAVHNTSTGWGVRVNGNWISTAGSTDSSVHWVTKTSAELGGSISSVEVYYHGNNGGYLHGIEIDGVLLVDSDVAGDNSYHLKMDPANSGTNYSGSSPEAVGGSMQNGGTPYIIDMSPADAQFQYYTNTGGAAQVFNGNITETAPNMAYLSDLNETTVWTLDLRDEGTVTSVKVHGSGGEDYGSTADGDNWVASLLDSSKSAIANTSVTLTSATHTAWTVPVAGTPKYLKFTQTTGSGPLFLTGIEVNGKILTNHGSIGYDSSGNNNHWHENNLFGHEATVANDNFKAVTYTGTGNAGLAITGVGFKPDFVWIKERGARNNVSHQLYDVVRGTSKMLQCDNTGAEADISGVTSFDTDGFTVGTNGGGNNSGSTYVAWCWKAGGAASANTDGATNSSVSVNNTAGFSIVKWEGQGAATNIGHGLSKAPSLIISKCLGSSQDWNVWHTSLGANNRMFLNTTADAESGGYPTVPTSSIFYVDNTGNFPDGQDVISYCFADVEGHSRFGSYNGNGSATGPVVDCGFTPGFVLIKRTSNANDWTIYDTARDGIGSATNELYPNTSGAEWGSGPIDINANGFQIKNTHTHLNASGDTYVYAAFAGTPGGDLDLLADVPGAPYDNGLNGGGNYPTFNTVFNVNGDTFSDGNLKVVTNSSNYGVQTSNMAFPASGKWYAEVDIVEDKGWANVGLVAATETDFTTTKWAGAHTNAYIYYGRDAKKYLATTATNYGATWTTGDMIGIAWNADDGELTFYKNGVSQGVITSIPIQEYFTITGDFNSGGSDTYVINFGQRAFRYTVPAGYKALNAYNLPAPGITKSNTAFDTKLWTGTGSSRSITGLEFNPDLVWIKRRDGDISHQLYDSVRGVNEKLSPNTNADEETTANSLTAFNSDGFDLNSYASVNSNNNTFVGWAWDAGTANVTSTGVGSLDSIYRANIFKGFSIVTFTDGSTSGLQSIAHGLNDTPAFIILKPRDLDQSEWSVFHKSFPSDALYLHLNNAKFNSSRFNSTAGTSSVFYWNDNSTNGKEIVAYCWSEIAGYSKFGSYAANGSTDGLFIHCGFKPAFLIIKNTGATESWIMWDNRRNTGNVTNTWLSASDSWVESTQYYPIDFLSNGFKIRNNAAGVGQTGNTYLWAAWAESPFKYANAV